MRMCLSLSPLFVPRSTRAHSSGIEFKILLFAILWLLCSFSFSVASYDVYRLCLFYHQVFCYSRSCLKLCVSFFFLFSSLLFTLLAFLFFFSICSNRNKDAYILAVPLFHLKCNSCGSNFIDYHIIFFRFLCVLTWIHSSHYIQVLSSKDERNISR